MRDADGVHQRTREYQTSPRRNPHGNEPRGRVLCCSNFHPDDEKPDNFGHGLFVARMKHLMLTDASCWLEGGSEGENGFRTRI